QRLSRFKGLTPFDFQKEAYNDCMNFLYNDSSKTGIATLPTAWGKSLLASWLSISLHEDGNKCLMVVPSIELLKQNLKKLKSYTNEDIGVYSGSMNEKNNSCPIVIASLQSLKNKHLD